MAARNWYSSLRHISVFSALLAEIASAVTPQTDHHRNLKFDVRPHYSFICSGPSKTSVSLPVPCPARNQLHSIPCPFPSDTLVFLLFLQPARSTPSLASPPQAPSPQVLHGPHLHVTQTPWGTSSQRQPGCHPHSIFVHPSPIRTGELCPPAAHTRMGSETSSGDTSRVEHLWPRCSATQPHFWC